MKRKLASVICARGAGPSLMALDWSAVEPPLRRPTFSLNYLSDRVLARHNYLKRLMTAYVRYYHEDRTHLALEKRTPAGRVAAADTDVTCEVLAMPRVGGLHHHYSVAA